jgi:hypothetical protein
MIVQFHLEATPILITDATTQKAVERVRQRVGEILRRLGQPVDLDIGSPTSIRARGFHYLAGDAVQGVGPAVTWEEDL